MEEEKKSQQQSQENVKEKEVKQGISNEIVEEPKVKTKIEGLIEQPKNKKNLGAICLSGCIGLLVGALIVAVIWKSGIINLNNKTIATINSGKYTDKDLYEAMKEDYPFSYVIDAIDKKLLNEKYPLTDEQQKEIDDQIESVLKFYTLYGYTEQQFLTQSGFESKEDFREYLEFDYQRNLVYIDYLDELISDEEVQKYYDENVATKINTKHMLVQVTDTVKDEDAKKMAEEIIKKLDEGEKFDKVAEEYGDKIIFEEVGYTENEEDLAKEYEEAGKKLEIDTYTKTPVKTSFGYHVIYRLAPKTLEDAKSEILEALGNDLEKEDTNIRYKALIKFRENNGLEFKDEDYKKEYEDYCKTYGV